jgi:hypothetical protein
MCLVDRVIPMPRDAGVHEALRLGMQEALVHGVTQIHDMGDGDWRALALERSSTRLIRETRPSCIPCLA